MTSRAWIEGSQIDMAILPRTPARAIHTIQPTDCGIHRLARLEKASFPSGLQASEAVIRERFRLGHRTLALVEGDTVVAAGSFVHTSQVPTDRATFPADHKAFSSLPASEPVRSTYVYSLCVTPSRRGTGAVRTIVNAIVDDARAHDAKYLVGNARCPAYSGRDPHGPDRVGHDPAFRDAVDSWHATGVRPATEVLIRDPLLRLYSRYLHCEFLYPAPDFLPEDTASGGFSVIFVKRLVRQPAGAR